MANIFLGSVLSLHCNDRVDLAEKLVPREIWVVASILEEGRGADLGNCGALSRAVRQQAHNEVLEALAEVHAVNSLEVGIVSLRANHLVVLVLKDLCAMWELTLDDNEEQYAHREQIHLSAVIDKLLEHLRSDVAWRTYRSCHLR